MSLNLDIHLACMECDRMDYSSTTLEKAIQDGWNDITQCPPTKDWWTHLGYCPECRQHAEDMLIGCINCGSKDGIAISTELAKAAGWTDIFRKTEMATDDERSNGSHYTHLGFCPKCSKLREEFKATGQ